MVRNFQCDRTETQFMVYNSPIRRACIIGVTFGGRDAIEKYKKPCNGAAGCVWHDSGPWKKPDMEPSGTLSWIRNTFTISKN
jgi:hypothetical protein